MDSDGVAARIGLKLGTIGEGRGTSMVFKQRGNSSRNGRAMTEVCTDAQLGLISSLCGFKRTGRRIRLKMEMIGDTSGTKGAPKLRGDLGNGWRDMRRCCNLL